MSKNSKYDAKVEQDGITWKATITRQVTSKKTMVSKQQDDFPSEASAQQWAEQELLEFRNTQDASNKRHGEQRKLSEEQRRLRSARRADKTEKIKLAKLKEEQEQAASSKEESDDSSL